MSPKPVGMAVAGTGTWCRALANALDRSAAFKIITCYTRTAAKREEFAATYGCEQETSYENVLKRKDVEAVLITTPNSAHAGLTLLAAEYGKHVLVEKPIANLIPEAKQMVEACRKKGVVLSVAHNQRRLAGYRRMKALLEAGALGKVIMAEANFSHNRGFKMTPDEWRWYAAECPGGSMMTMGVHPADSLQYLLGPIQSVSAFYTRLCLKTENIDTGAALLTFASGGIGYLASNYITPWTNYCNLYGTEANLYFTVDLPAPQTKDPKRYGDNWNYADRDSKLHLKRKGEDQKTEVTLEAGEILKEEVEEFAECIRKGKTPEVGGAEGLRSLAIILAANRSAQTGKIVRVDDILAE